MRTADKHGNVIAQEGVTRCPCGAKYWENDKCVSCGAAVQQTPLVENVRRYRVVFTDDILSVEDTVLGVTLFAGSVEEIQQQVDDLWHFVRHNVREN